MGDGRWAAGIDARHTFEETVNDRVEVDLASYVGHDVWGV
jgi:hypothetical protein